jgi:hypothetical protein
MVFFPRPSPTRSYLVPVLSAVFVLGFSPFAASDATVSANSSAPDDSNVEAGTESASQTDDGTFNVNLISNPGFESKLTDWESDGASKVVSRRVYSGVSALRIGKRAGGVSQFVSGLLPDHHYDFSVWARLGSRSAQEVFVGVSFKDAAGADIPGYVYIKNVKGTAWKRYSISVASPPSFTYATVFIWTDRGSSYVYLDDYSLK